jgi:hypothetical protein
VSGEARRVQLSVGLHRKMTPGIVYRTASCRYAVARYSLGACFLSDGVKDTRVGTASEGADGHLAASPSQIATIHDMIVLVVY